MDGRLFEIAIGSFKTPDTPPPNPTITVVSDVAATLEDTSTTVSVLANNSTTLGTLSVQSAAGAAHGALVLNADNTITYSPLTNFFGTDGFTYTVVDGLGHSSSGSVSLSVIAVNDAPTGTDDVATVIRDSTVQINVLGNDIDPDAGDSLHIVSVGATTFQAASSVGNDRGDHLFRQRGILRVNDAWRYGQ